MFKTIAVIVTYNRKELLRESIDALLAQSAEDLGILIADNASTDGTQEYLADYIESGKIIYCNTGANLGGAGGFNYGMKKAMEVGCEYVWLMDDDCITHPDTLEKLLEADQKLNGQYGFLASKVLWKDGSICQMNIPRATLTKPVTNFETELQPIVMASFVSVFIKSDVVRQFGLPIKDFFIWTDDWEYTRRISRKISGYLVADSVVTHKSAQNIGANIASDTADRLGRYNYLYRNDVYLYRREGIKGWCYLIPRLCVHILRVLLKSPDSKAKRIKLLLSATVKGFSFNPEIEFIGE